MVDHMASEPRPAAKHAAMKGVEVEQITVPSPKPKPGVSSKPSTGSMGKGIELQVIPQKFQSCHRGVFLSFESQRIGEAIL